LRRRHCRGGIRSDCPRLAFRRPRQGGHRRGRADLAPARLQREMKPNAQFQVSLEAAHLYDRVAVRYVLGPWAPLLVDAVLLRPGECVLDVACGTGVVTRIAAQRVGPQGRVTGVDLNAGMISVARSLPAPDGAAIDWLEGDRKSTRLNSSHQIIS